MFIRVTFVFFALKKISVYHLLTQVFLKFLKLITEAQQREAVVQGRSLSPYRLRYICGVYCNFVNIG
ncbi:MAG: hypothetical protein LBJ00_05395 [Planctomycetaceae bacterium]|nr:hypothetical protein [Planctomycetaceae bacterium]